MNGTKKSLRLQQAEQLFAQLPAEHKPAALAFQNLLKTVKPVAVDSTFAPDGELGFISGVVSVGTPGHMPGHVSLYLPASKTLIAADAVVYEGGELQIANPQFTLDMPQAITSVKKLQQLDIAQLICYHGGVVHTGIQSKLSKLVQQYTAQAPAQV